MKSNLKHKGFVFACVAPAVILFTIFMVVPTFNVFRLSLFQRSTFNPNEIFVGLKNFEMLMRDATFIRSMQNMLLLIVMVTVFTMGTALVFAGILTREKLRGNDFFRIVFYIPNILSVVVISGIFSAIYDVDRGMLNSILSIFGVDGILWRASSMLSRVWSSPWSGRPSATTWSCICPPWLPFPSLFTSPRVWTAPAGWPSSSRSPFP